MTDREKLVALLRGFGVEFFEEQDIIICDQGSQKVDGYLGFYTLIEFTAEGKFIQMGAWE